jgi:hypothetical protein
VINTFCIVCMLHCVTQEVLQCHYPSSANSDLPFLLSLLFSLSFYCYSSLSLPSQRRYFDLQGWIPSSLLFLHADCKSRSGREGNAAQGESLGEDIVYHFTSLYLFPSPIFSVLSSPLFRVLSFIVLAWYQIKFKISFTPYLHLHIIPLECSHYLHILPLLSSLPSLPPLFSLSSSPLSNLSLYRIPFSPPKIGTVRRVIRSIVTVNPSSAQVLLTQLADVLDVVHYFHLPFSS